MHIQNILIQATLMATAPTPIIVPPGNTGCLVAPVPNSQRIYYQAEDTTIREIIAGGFPGTNPVVTEQVLIPAGVARPNTPMTCASWGDTDYLGVSMVQSAIPRKPESCVTQPLITRRLTSSTSAPATAGSIYAKKVGGPAPGVTDR